MFNTALKTTTSSTWSKSNSTDKTAVDAEQMSNQSDDDYDETIEYLVQSGHLKPPSNDPKSKEKNAENEEELKKNNDEQRFLSQLEDFYQFSNDAKLIKALKKDLKLITFWKQDGKLRFPLVYKVARVSLGVPVTQCSVERSFSILKFVVNPLRSKLKGPIIDNLVLLKANFKDKASEDLQINGFLI